MSNIYTSADQLTGGTPLLELTHLEQDHHLEARILAKLEYFNPAGSVKDRVAKAMLDAAERTGTAMQVPAPGQRLSLDAHASLAFLAPDPDAVFESVNDYSIISLLSADGLRVLFTGDAEAAAEQALLDSGADIACDVLKVGHHGSDTSSTDAFLDAAAPKIAVISCGKYNEYGHPHPKTLARLQAHGAAIHVTADTGTFLYPTPDT